MRLLLAVLLGTFTLLSQELQTTAVITGIAAPTGIENAGDGSGRLFLVQQSGKISIFRSGALLPQPFLDIGAKTVAGGERGLLGLAFPPSFARTQRFYVDYTDLSGNTVIAQYQVSADRNVADPASEIVLLRIAQPFENHNGGQVRFGPDGYLYIGMGDGGSAGDPQGNGQNPGTLLGKLLRIDVETDPGHVLIPPDNPFVNTASARPEIWALGLRNPWRFSFDRANRDLWIADVGQDSYEEIDYQPADSKGGQNYGWNRMEGMHCYQSGCSSEGLTLPIAEYGHDQGCSVTGGFVYRGLASLGLRGLYLYADYCSGRIWGLERQAGKAVNKLLLLASGFSITTFGEDESGEIYLANATNGTIYQLQGSRAPRFSASGVVNGANYAPGITAGSLATIFVAGVLDSGGIVSASTTPIVTALRDVSVSVDGIAAPIVAIANVNGQEQVNFQTPFEIAGHSTAQIVVTRAGVSSDPVDVPVVDLQPAFFTVNGGNALLVHNSDYSLVTAEKPLQPGEFVFAYVSGLGPVSNQPAGGALAPRAPLSSALAKIAISLGGHPADVQFAGLAPDTVGVYQVNFQVPTGIMPGLQDLAITASSVAGTVAKAPVQ